MNVFIASDEIVFATHLQIRIRLQTSMFIAGDEHVSCWGRTLLVLEMNAFGTRDERIRAGDEHFSARNEHIANANSSVSDAHTASYQ